MAGRRRLSDLERLEIVRETRKAVSAQVLGKRFGVTPRTIQYTVRREKLRKRDSGIRTAQIGTTVTPEELRDFEALLGRHGITSRSDGMRRLIQAANGVFQPDEHLADVLVKSGHKWSAQPRATDQRCSSQSGQGDARQRKS
jgi:hypothetical protein